MSIFDSVNTSISNTAKEAEREQIRQEIIKEYSEGDFWISTLEGDWIEAEINFRLNIKHAAAIERTRNRRASAAMREQWKYANRRR